MIVTIKCDACGHSAPEAKEALATHGWPDGYVCDGCGQQIAPDREEALFAIHSAPGEHPVLIARPVTD